MAQSVAQPGWTHLNGLGNDVQGKETKLELAMANSRNNRNHSENSDMRVVNSLRKILEISELFVTSLESIKSWVAHIRG